MTMKVDLFNEINNAVLDLQGSHDQSFERPLKILARLLHHSDLESINCALTTNVDFDEFMAQSEDTGGVMAGSHRLAWPVDHEPALGLTLILIDRLAADHRYTIYISHKFFNSGRDIIASIHSLTRQVIIPFVRDYKSYVLNFGDSMPRLLAPNSNKVFIVHGHDDAALQVLARFLEKLGLNAIILKEEPDQGRTIIEKFEAWASEVGFAVILLTPDDLGGVANASDHRARARQNVIFELGFFSGKLGRGHVCLLRKGDVEIPSDLFGVIYTEMDAADGWKSRLIGELKAANIDVDPNRLWRRAFS